VHPGLRRLAAPLAVATAVVVAAAIPAAGGAGGPAGTDELQRESSALAAESRSALLELYALESKLGGARARLSSLRERAGHVERLQSQTRIRLGVARRTIAVSERMLAERLMALYQQGETDALAIVLGAESLDEALSRLDGMRFAAEQDRRILGRTESARSSLARLATSLRARRAELRRLEMAASVEAVSLERAHAERTAYLVRLASERRFNAAQLASLERRAASARAATRSVASVATASAAPQAVAVMPEAQAHGAGTLTVIATGYALTGTTASGLPVGWGVVAVDPGLIPLGTRMTVPGYGIGVAADTGGNVSGAEIDLWFPSEAEALAWGRRTVTIRLH
jgi:3D (Asp-Asp-Asp) domain-containing protein